MAPYLFEQLLNGIQLGFILFLVASGLTLILGIANVLNLAHGAFYMVGAYLAASVAGATGSFWMGLAAAALGTGGFGLLVERLVVRRLYTRDHLDQVLATFALLLIANEAVRMVWGSQPLNLAIPRPLAQPLELGPIGYSAYRLTLMGIGLLLSLAFFWVISRSRVGMWLRAAASNWTMARSMGIRVSRLYTGTFGASAALAGVAGALVGPITAVHLGMSSDILILCFVTVVIGGVGSIKGAFWGAMLVGLVDTAGRAFLPSLFQAVFPPAVAANLGPTLVAMAVYLLMALVLIFRPEGLFPSR
ncbi:MAG: branched-chain amino acid ABC transporter permease [Thermus sp.]|uniref:branched-chain amino acid ABC transporter permease n=1 Tax=Thermus sp. TaxID=275 RepID=UPI0025D7CF7F|nr:branched-chain amino acid ABC transporter permease [Thermus sp.]MCS7219277.1 branched-chain amino acid ABC transporter permease [Thermus sp.]MDW8018216.1 branched-chain amino acid ABC transporter permease [Thermus sp.]